MKTKLLLLLFLLAFNLPVFSQQKVTKYVTVGVNSVFSKYSIIKVDLGNIDSLLSFKESKIKSQLQQVNSLKKGTDVLNYMSSIGWTFIAFANDYFIFKREFDPSELTPINNH